MEFKNQYGENTMQSDPLSVPVGSDAPIIILIFIVLVITYIFSYSNY
jgi:hypothetical protein